jgi:circadian clock protein KaiC
MATEQRFFVERVVTGVNGLDDMLYGGIPGRSQVLISGNPGTGKTLLSFEILYRNAEVDIAGTFITFEESVEAVISNAKNAFLYFEDIDELVTSRKLNIMAMPIITSIKSREAFEAVLADLNKEIQSNGSKLVVIDSLTTLRTLYEDDRAFTRAINLMIANFKQLGVTTLVTMETNSLESSHVSGLYGTFMFDGIIALTTSSVEGSFQYMIRIVKMRRTNHRTNPVPYEITPNGINIFK